MSNTAFTLLQEKHMTEVGGIARLWRHNITGAELLSICNNDENKCFSATFRTPPSDSTGVAHILEHSVLCGSEKYPVKEPFVELLKGSLQTFLNAFTFPDKTSYPVASTNLRDFYNLVDVYMDAVFAPRITEAIFQQEGWHIEADAPDSPWSFKGVVYNEMKGAYSSPDSVLAEQSQQSLYPDTLYSLDSGGNPEVIPQLTYEAFKNFHSSYYHPSNARFFFWGDDPEEERLNILAKTLAPYTKRAVDSSIPLQKRKDTPRLLEIPYAATEEENRAYLTVNWMLSETSDVDNSLLFAILEHILEGLPGSPLRKALIESGLGEDTTGVGLETDVRQMYYSTGLKGLAPEDVRKAEMLIFDTLGQLAEEGIPQAAVDAAINSVEFDLRENNSGSFPRGLVAMIQSLSTWLYDGDPFAALAWEAPLNKLKERLAKGEKVFEEAISTWFLNNNHRATVVLLPDARLGEMRLKTERDRLESIQKVCSAEERAAVVANTVALQQAQATPDSPEALATIPHLEVTDLPEKNTLLPLRTDSTPPNTCLFHELDTSGIVYSSFLFPIDTVPAKLLPLLPLLGRTFTEMGTQERDYADLGMRIAAHTGGIGAGLFVSNAFASNTPVAYMKLSGKAVASKQQDFFDILHEILLRPQPIANNQERILQMLLETKARLEQYMLSFGNRAMLLRLRARHTIADWLNEITGGVSYLQSVRSMIDRVSTDWDGVVADLTTLRQIVVQSNRALFDCTASTQDCAAAQQGAQTLLKSLPALSHPIANDWQPAAFPVAEAFRTPAQVNYVGMGCNLYKQGYTFHGSAAVIFRYLRMGYLWDRVRVQGGAYGVACLFGRVSGNLSYVSFRDPSVSSTLNAYTAVPDFLRNFRPDQQELTRAIVGAVGDLDTHLLPDAKGAHALTHHLTGDTEEQRQQLRDEMRATTARHFHDFADILEEARSRSVIAALGGASVERTATEHNWTLHQLF